MADSDKTKTIDGFAYWIENDENGVCYIPLNLCEKIMKLLKEQQQKKSKEEVLLAIIGKQSYTDLEKFKQLEKLNDEYFSGMLDSIRAVEKLFDDH